MEDLEKKIFEFPLSEDNHLASLFADPAYTGWYVFEVEENPFKDIVCLFRLPETIKLYKGVLKKFEENERKAGLYRLPLGKEMQFKLDHIFKKLKGSDAINNLSDSELDELISNSKKTVTFDCNKIPYLHIRKSTLRDDEININKEIKKHVGNQPNFLQILFDTTNEKISLEQAEITSQGVIYNEFKDIFKG